jgi:hypothetical protein
MPADVELAQAPGSGSSSQQLKQLAAAACTRALHLTRILSICLNTMFGMTSITEQQVRRCWDVDTLMCAVSAPGLCVACCMYVCIMAAHKIHTGCAAEFEQQCCCLHCDPQHGCPPMLICPSAPLQIRVATAVYKCLGVLAKLHTPAKPPPKAAAAAAAAAGGSGSGISIAGGSGTGPTGPGLTPEFKALVLAVHKDVTPPLYSFLQDTQVRSIDMWGEANRHLQTLICHSTAAAWASIPTYGS